MSASDVPCGLVVLPWDEPAWLADITSWTRAQADVSGPVQLLHRRAWSAMLRARSSNGDLFVKATAPGSVYEVALTEDLARSWPELTVELVAADPARGWMLMRDAGEPLRDRLARDPDLDIVRTLYRRYAELQVAMAGRTESLLAMGVPDRRTVRLPELLCDLPVDSSVVHDLIAAVTACSLPDTLVHEEVHDGNVVVRDGAPVIIDWADSSVGHPFFGVVVGLRSISDRLDLPPGAEQLEQVLSAYLDPWTGHAPADDLRAAFPAAYRLGMLNRALTWRASLAGLDEADRADHVAYVDAWLEEFTAAVDPLPGT